MAFGFQSTSSTGFVQIDGSSKSYRILASGSYSTSTWSAFVNAYVTDFGSVSERTVNFAAQSVVPLVFVRTSQVTLPRKVVLGCSYGLLTSVGTSSFQTMTYQGDRYTGWNYFAENGNGVRTYNGNNIIVDYIVVVPVSTQSADGHGLKIFAENGTTAVFDSGYKYFGIDSIVSLKPAFSYSSIYGTTLSVTVPVTPANHKRYVLLNSLSTIYAENVQDSQNGWSDQIHGQIAFAQVSATQIDYLTGIIVDYEAGGTAWSTVPDKTHTLISGTARV